MTEQSTVAMRRRGIPAIVALATMTVLAAPGADAAPRQAAPTEAVAPREAGEPIMAIVSIKSQQVTFYDADGWILRAPVSTGTTGRETPAGVFAVIEKDKDHHSTMYDDAWMPNMQRITWNGIALHGGPLPGYAASHGCVRMPYGFAEKLFEKTRIGMRVIISPNDAAPLDFTHPALFVPNAEAIAAAPARAEKLAREAAEVAEVADKAKKAVTTTARDVTALTASLRKLEMLKKNAATELAYSEKVLAAADQTRTRAEEQKQKAATKAADLAKQLDAAQADLKAKVDASAAVKAAGGTDEAAKKAAALAARDEALATASLRKVEMLKKMADAELANADKMLANAEQARTRAEEQKQKAATKAADLATQLDTAKADLKSKQDAATAAKDAAKAAEAKKSATAKTALDAKLALEPVSVYISRATQKLYVRRNTHKPAPDGGGEVFDTTIEVPVTIRNPEKRLGTHIFTAMAKDGAGLRWTVVTIDGEDAKDALDRITIPQEVLDRIGPTVLPRSSIIISDEPLSKETNYRTEFVAVLNDHPQGGFITRKPTPRDDLRIANRDDSSFGFSSFFSPQRNWWEPQPTPVDPRRRRGPQDYRQQQPRSIW